VSLLAFLPECCCFHTSRTWSCAPFDTSLLLWLPVLNLLGCLPSCLLVLLHACALLCFCSTLTAQQQ
jgi:hypothetical protein